MTKRKPLRWSKQLLLTKPPVQRQTSKYDLNTHPRLRLLQRRRGRWGCIAEMANANSAGVLAWRLRQLHGANGWEFSCRGAKVWGSFGRLVAKRRHRR